MRQNLVGEGKKGGGVVILTDGWRLGKGHTVPLGTTEGEDVQFTENPCLRVP